MSMEQVWIWIAWHLPRTLVSWCFVRVLAHATQGKWSSQDVTTLTCTDAGKRWDDAD